ncbi:uncharacterized protein PHACADRAFT_189221, partial [Phanerochaete carnosa HHB-10118-sp]
MIKHPLSKVPKPVTPLMRRFLRDVFKPTVALGKRRTRYMNQENHPPADWTPTEPNKPSSSSFGVALQNEDSEDEDAVVITALAAAPFCCHADLLTMARPQLVAAARTLNAKLPRALHVDATRANASIRRSIERLVGIRSSSSGSSGNDNNSIDSDAPRRRAPKRRRSPSLDTAPDADADASAAEHSTAREALYFSPVSPLAARSQSAAAVAAASCSMLASLREEPDEDETGEADRPSKRRRTEEDEEEEEGEEEDASRDGTPTFSRAPTAPSNIYSPAHRLHRSQSHRLPAAPGLLPLLHRNITVARPGRRTRSQSAAVLTSTPRVRRWVPKAPGRAGASASASGAAAAAVAREDSLSEPSSGVSAGTTASQDSLDRVERVSGWLEGGGGG